MGTGLLGVLGEEVGEVVGGDIGVVEEEGALVIRKVD
jgi:hypothetical protein